MDFGKSLGQVHPFYRSSKPCSTGTHNETVKKLALVPAFIISNYDGITASYLESRLNVISCSIESKVTWPYHINS